MIELDPRKWRPGDLKSNPFVYGLIALAGVIALGTLGFIIYDKSRPKYAEVYDRLGIKPLPAAVESTPNVQRRLDELRSKPCDREAIIPFAESLMRADLPREGATSILNFSVRCGPYPQALDVAYRAFYRLRDWPAALKVANELVKQEPGDSRYRFLRAAVREETKDNDGALRDYTGALLLLGDAARTHAMEFRRVSRAYAALGRYCEAMSPLETYMTFDKRHQTEELQKLVADYADKGNCRATHARGTDKLALSSGSRAIEATVAINGVAGRFMFDPSATYVTVTPEFATRAQLAAVRDDPLPLKIAGKPVPVTLDTAGTISVGNTSASNVAVAVATPAKPFGVDIDGLIGMSYLARFNVTSSDGGVELEARTLEAKPK
jgi:predicted aspartyl protease